MAQPLPSLDILLDAVVDRLVPRLVVQIADELERRGHVAEHVVGDPARLLTPQEVASRYGLSIAAVYKRAARGTIPSVKDGGRRRFRADQIEAHIRSLPSGEAEVLELAQRARRRA